MFSKRLKNLRTKKGVTQSEMGDLLGISRQGYAKYENEKSEPDHETIKRLANYFDVTTDYLLGKSNQPRLTEKDETDIAKRMEKMRKDLMEGNANGEGLSFKGEPMSEEAMESLLESLEILERQTTLINKKYIPKKYRDK